MEVYELTGGKTVTGCFYAVREYIGSAALRFNVLTSQPSACSFGGFRVGLLSLLVPLERWA